MSLSDYEKTLSRPDLSPSLLSLAMKYAEAVQARVKAEKERDELRDEIQRLRQLRGTFNFSGALGPLL